MSLRIDSRPSKVCGCGNFNALVVLGQKVFTPFLSLTVDAYLLFLDSLDVDKFLCLTWLSSCTIIPVFITNHTILYLTHPWHFPMSAIISVM